MKVFGTDFDGTIIDSEKTKSQAFGDIVHKWWGADKQEAINFWMAKGGSSRRYKFDYFYQKKFLKPLNDSEYLNIGRKFSDRLKRYYPKVRFFPYALKTLKFIKDNFDFVFLSSGMPTEEIQYLVRITSLSSYFDLILGTDSNYASKKEHLQKVIERKNPELMVFMGDGLEDMKLAKELNIVSIGITTSNSRKALTKAGADHVCSLSGVKPIVLKLLGGRHLIFPHVRD